MKRALKEISDMATSLEASGMERRQAVATLEAIANSIEKFAVTRKGCGRPLRRPSRRCTNASRQRWTCASMG